MGLFHNCATVRATTATATNGGAIPGPKWSLHIQSKLKKWSDIYSGKTYMPLSDAKCITVYNIKTIWINEYWFVHW